MSSSTGQKFLLGTSAFAFVMEGIWSFGIGSPSSGIYFAPRLRRSSISRRRRRLEILPQEIGRAYMEITEILEEWGGCVVEFDLERFEGGRMVLDTAEMEHRIKSEIFRKNGYSGDSKFNWFLRNIKGEFSPLNLQEYDSFYVDRIMEACQIKKHRIRPLILYWEKIEVDGREYGWIWKDEYSRNIAPKKNSGSPRT